MSKAPIKKPLAVDMGFGEALERFAMTDPRELKARMGQTGKGNAMPLTWSKRLSKTDAQQETTGGLVPYLRLTSGDDKRDDFQTWFSDTFFGDAGWTAGEFGREQGVELANVPMSVVVTGVKLPPMVFLVSHGPNRHEKHDAPNTWLHWPDALQSILQDNDFTDHTIRLTKHGQGQYLIEILAE